VVSADAHSRSTTDIKKHSSSSAHVVIANPASELGSSGTVGSLRGTGDAQGTPAVCLCRLCRVCRVCGSDDVRCRRGGDY
jgi:hypothetical protein